MAEAEEDRVRAQMEEKEKRRREEEDLRRATEQRQKEEQAALATRRAQTRQKAISVFGEGEDEAVLVTQASALQNSAAGGAGTRDFLSRAMAALGPEADDDASSDEEEGPAEAAPDLQLIQASETIAAHIQRAAAARGRSGA